jgi:hypothetical protein
LMSPICTRKTGPLSHERTRTCGSTASSVRLCSCGSWFIFFRS